MMMVRWTYISYVKQTECPAGSTEASLEVTVAWEDSEQGVMLFVVEPGGTEVYGFRHEQLGVSTQVLFGFPFAYLCVFGHDSMPGVSS